jgi:hypothetical protein
MRVSQKQSYKSTTTISKNHSNFYIMAAGVSQLLAYACSCFCERAAALLRNSAAAQAKAKAKDPTLG